VATHADESNRNEEANVEEHCPASGTVYVVSDAGDVSISLQKDPIVSDDSRPTDFDTGICQIQTYGSCPVHRDVWFLDSVCIAQIFRSWLRQVPA
jgi:hypothetical protein